jgi:hypothetical protein
MRWFLATILLLLGSLANGQINSTSRARSASGSSTLTDRAYSVRSPTAGSGKTTRRPARCCSIPTTASASAAGPARAVLKDTPNDAGSRFTT